MSAERTFHLVAHVSSERPELIRPLLEERFGPAAMAISGGFHVEADLVGESARELNRELLSALRALERRTRLRSEWSSQGTTERFFDYVPRANRPSG